MPSQGKHGKARAAAVEAREDIISSTAMSAMSAGAVSAMGTIGAAVVKQHKFITFYSSNRHFINTFKLNCQISWHVKPYRCFIKRNNIFFEIFMCNFKKILNN